MSVERKFMKNLDEKILSASGEELKKLQELDVQTQLNGTTIYDEYLAAPANSPKKETISHSKTHPKK